MGTTADFNRFALPDNLTQDWLFNVGDAISFGDLMYDGGSDKARPADTMTSLTTEALDQDQFAAKFIGVAQQQILAAETNANKRLTIRTDCVCEFKCPSQTFNKGDLVGIYSNGTNLDPQQVDAATQSEQAIGIVVKYYGTATTRVRVRIFDRKTLDIVSSIQSASLGDQQNAGVTAAGDANQTLTVASQIIQKCTPTAARTWTLPAVAQSKGFWFYVVNQSTGFAITVQNATPTTIGVVLASSTGLFFCDGANWYCLNGAGSTNTTTSITASVDPLPINGLAAAQGGAVTVTGGTSSTSANAGGAVNLTGGTPGATGVGGAINITGAVGGATSGTGGAVNIIGGAGTAGNATGGLFKGVGGAGQGTGLGGAAQLTGGASGTGATGAGGAATVTGGASLAVNDAGGAASLIGGAGAGTGAGGAITITSGAAGATGVAGAVNISVGAATAGNGSAVTITGGNGAGGTNAGGNINFVPGAAVSTGTPGEVQVNSAAGLFSVVWQQGQAAAPSAGSFTIFQATRAYRVKAMNLVYSTASSSGTATITKDTGTTAPGGGTALLTGTVSTSSTANTTNSGTLIATVATLTMAAGDRIGLTLGGTQTGLAGLVVSVGLVPC